MQRLADVFRSNGGTLLLGINDLLLRTPGDMFWQRLGGQKALNWYRTVAYRPYWTGMWSDQELFDRLSSSFPGSSVPDDVDEVWRQSFLADPLVLSALQDWQDRQIRLLLLADGRADIMQEAFYPSGSDLFRISRLSETSGTLLADEVTWEKISYDLAGSEAPMLYIDSRIDHFAMAQQKIPGLLTHQADEEGRWLMRAGRHVLKAV